MQQRRNHIIFRIASVFQSCITIPNIQDSKMGKLNELILQPIANVIEKIQEKRATTLHRSETGDPGADSQTSPETPRVNTKRDPPVVSGEEVARREEECVSCKIIIMTTFIMYGTAILLIPTTEKYKQSMRKYLKNKNTVLGIFVVHSALGAACFGGAFYQGLKFKEILDRRKAAEEGS